MVREESEISRRAFLGGAVVSVAAAGCRSVGVDKVAALAPAEPHEGIRVKFLGTAAAVPGRRRNSSILVEGRVLVDLTRRSLDMLPEGVRPETIFYTHSHGDHYSPRTALEAGVRRVYVHESWADGARVDFAAAAKARGVEPPEVIGLAFGKAVEVEGLRFTAVPANHCTSRLTNGVLERTALYLIEKGPARLLYATDTGGLPGEAARLAGIDKHVWQDKSKLPPHIPPPQPITALIMEATMGVGLEDDFRIFVHSSVATVAQTVRVLTATERYLPPPGQPVYITHMGVGFDEDDDAVDRTLPEPLKAARDGLEVVLG